VHSSWAFRERINAGAAFIPEAPSDFLSFAVKPALGASQLRLIRKIRAFSAAKKFEEPGVQFRVAPFTSADKPGSHAAEVASRPCYGNDLRAALLWPTQSAEFSSEPARRETLKGKPHRAP
jgi:hypothetical protein